MGREDWVPSRHQYICHEHFTSSCFKLRWGIRYLENNAVPTVFQLPEKRKVVDPCEKKYKRLRYSTTPRMTSSGDGLPVKDTMEPNSDCNTAAQMYEIAVEPSQCGEMVLVESSAVKPSEDAPQADLPMSTATEGDYPVALFQTLEGLDGLDCQEHSETVVVWEEPPVDGQEELVGGITSAVRTGDQAMAMNDPTGHSVEAQTSLLIGNVAPEIEEPSFTLDDPGAQIAYFETIPNILSNATLSQFSISPDTVLSTALSSRPIVSTLPIVSKHMPPASPNSLILTLERLETVGEEAEGDTLEEDSTYQQGSQLEEHRYHKNSLSKEQLEAIVIELQKKVKVLQQRHRRHLDKLLGLENTVSQLRQSNLLNEERLQLLERAYIQTSAAVTDAGETVAIIYEEDTAYLYTRPVDEEKV